MNNDSKSHKSSSRAQTDRLVMISRTPIRFITITKTPTTTTINLPRAFSTLSSLVNTSSQFRVSKETSRPNNITTTCRHRYQRRKMSTQPQLNPSASVTKLSPTDPSSVPNPLGEGNYIKTAGCIIIG